MVKQNQILSLINILTVFRLVAAVRGVVRKSGWDGIEEAAAFLGSVCLLKIPVDRDWPIAKFALQPTPLMAFPRQKPTLVKSGPDELLFPFYFHV